jgi:phage tail-like protein
MAIAADAQLGMSMRFTVKIDNTPYDLGSWAKVSGLDVSWDLVEYRAGDGPQNERWYFPGLTKYSTLKLERAVQAADTKKVREWLDSNSFKHEIQSGKVELLDAKSEAVMFWTLRHVLPTKWSISPFDSTTSKVATETLELAHMGFLENE